MATVKDGFTAGLSGNADQRLRTTRSMSAMRKCLREGSPASPEKAAWLGACPGMHARWDINRTNYKFCSYEATISLGSQKWQRSSHDVSDSKASYAEKSKKMVCTWHKVMG